MPNTPSNKVPLNGLFRNGVWLCNCIPRLPAIQFTVRKESRNKGRSFYTCQKDKGKKNQCEFFLWAEDAHFREVGAVLTNSRSESQWTPGQSVKRQRTLHESITPSKNKRKGKTPVTSIAELDRVLSTASSATAQSSTVKASSGSAKENFDSLEVLFTSDEEDNDDDDEEYNGKSTMSSAKPTTRPSATQQQENTHSVAGSKRKRSDTDEYSDLSSGEEAALASLADSSAKAKGKAPDTKQHHRNAFDETPTTGGRTQHVVEDGLATPLTDKPVRRVLFAEPAVTTNNHPDAKRPRANNNDFDQPQPTSPIPSTLSFSKATPTPTPTSSQEYSSPLPLPNITQEVMSLLLAAAPHPRLDETLLRTVRSALERHAARAKGLERGRDASRDAVRKAEARAAELQLRVADLENQRRLDAEARARMRAELAKLYCDS